MFTFWARKTQSLTWTLKDSNDAPISNALVKATLYANRSINDPVNTPGTAVPNFTDITLPETSTLGTYSGTLSILFDPQPADFFVLVVNATVSGVPFSYDETLAIVQPISKDLISLDDQKAWLGIKLDNLDDDEVLQFLITSFSQYVISRTGRDSFNIVNTYVDLIDGSGGTRLFLRNSPITAVSSVLIGSHSIPQSTSLTTAGYYIEASKKSIAFRVSPSLSVVGTFPYRFVIGQGNVQVTYSAGYINTPYDLAEAVMKAVAINYKRKDWIDLASKTLSAQQVSGTIRYRDWSLPPEVEKTLDTYSRYPRVGG